MVIIADCLSVDRGSIPRNLANYIARLERAFPIMKTIHKYPFNPEMSIPVGSKLLKVAYQGAQLYTWFLVDPEEEFTKVKYFEIFGTGQKITNNMPEFYVDTVFDRDGFVWHIFEYYHE